MGCGDNNGYRKRNGSGYGRRFYRGNEDPFHCDRGYKRRCCAPDGRRYRRANTVAGVGFMGLY